MPSLDDAMSLARQGWAVIPLRGKVPLTAHGVKDATTELDQVRAWWASGDHNIGARVPAHLFVLDSDPQNGGDLRALERAAGVDLPPTLTVHSGRGTGGQHRYYLHPGGLLTSRRLPPGIDVKTESGYCVMPPSLHPVTGQPYRWEPRDPVPLPAEVIALLRQERRARVPASGARGDDARMSRRALYLASYVSQLGEGNRNAGLFWAACRAVEDGHPESTFDLLEGAASAAGLDEHEASRTIASARRVQS